MTDSSVFSVDALANALEHRENQLRDQRRQEDARKIVRIVSEELDKVAYERVYGAPQREVVNANPSTQQSTSNGSHEPQQPAAQQGEGQQRPDPLVALAAREIASAEAVDVQALHYKAEELASINGRDPGQVANELAERVAALRGEVDESSAGQQGNPSRVPGSRVVKNLLSRDDR